MFSGTLRENLLIGIPDPGDEAIKQAAEMSGLLSAIVEHPKGLGMMIAEGGKGLSGGQKQQVAIVLSLLNDPPILFFDEPSNALDPQIRQKIWQIIRALKAMGKTVIFTTHYIEEAEALADRVAIMSKGQIIVTDTPENIIRQYNDSFNVEFELEHDVDVSAFGELGVHYRDGVYSFSVDAINAGVLQVIKDISEQFSLSKVSIGKSSLEDVFVRLTGEKALP